MQNATETAPDAVNSPATPTSKSEVKKGSFRRSEKGKLVINTLANWVVEKLRANGLAFPAWLGLGCKLSDIGITRTSAVAELKPRIPDAHRWYNESGNGKTYATWEEYWNGSLSNRCFYFFRKHTEGGIVAGLAEWPGTTDEWGDLVPPIIEEVL